VDWSKAKRPIVFVSGCYDLLHSGHVRFFEEASQLGHLYVSLGNDRNIQELKHHNTMFPEKERAYMVQSIRHVEWARVCQGMGDLDWESDLDIVKPDFFFVNEDGDRSGKRLACAKRNIKYVVAKRLPRPGLDVRSSTSIKASLKAKKERRKKKVDEEKEKTKIDNLQSLHLACDTISSKSNILKIRNGILDNATLKRRESTARGSSNTNKTTTKKKKKKNNNNNKSSWDIIAVTSKHKSHAQAFVNELRLHTNMSSTLMVPVADLDGETSMGSGGATLHALVQIVERLSALAGDPYLNEARLKGKRVLILHSGASPGNPTPWIPAPIRDENGRAMSGACALINALSPLTTHEPSSDDCSLFVCSGELDLTSLNFPSELSKLSGMTVLAVPCKIESAARKHGVYALESCSNSVYKIRDVVYKESAETLYKKKFALENKTCGDNVAMVVGVFHMDFSATQTFFSLHAVDPFSSCTHFGRDDGMVNAFPFSFFLDVVPAAAQVVSDSKRQARGLLRNLIGGNRFKTQAVLATVAPDSIRYVHNVGQNIQYTDKCSVVSLNSIFSGVGEIGTGSVIVNSEIKGKGWSVGQNCVVVGLEHTASDDGVFNIPPQCVVQQVRIENDMKVTTLFGIHDHGNETFMGKPWSNLTKRTGLKTSEIWPDKRGVKSLAHAKLFTTSMSPLWLASDDDTGVNVKLWRACTQRYSLNDLLSMVDMSAIFAWNESIRFRIDTEMIRDVLINRRHQALRSIYTRCAKLKNRKVFDILDSIALSSIDPDIAARSLAQIADVLAAFAGRGGGLRSGPARNTKWSSALSMLSKESTRSQGIREMAKLREIAISDRSSDSLIRASRHYEGGAQRLILLSTETCRKFVRTSSTSSSSTTSLKPLSENEWAVATCPARIDIAGGWSDTPPITFEHGGMVTNVALKLSGKRPIGARARVLSDPVLLLVVGDQQVRCEKMDDISDHNTPHAPAALFKCALLSIGILDMNKQETLVEQLNSCPGLKGGRGLEIRSWSDLPQGSGLGTSSILGACIVACAARAACIELNRSEIVHAVLLAEQLLSTGGGWQDQVGGVYGGAKLSSSDATLPVRVETKTISMPSGFHETLGQHLVLVYTGRQRLARNLLQNVVRRWYARLPEIVSTENDLVLNAQDAAVALKNGDLVEIGKCLSLYWEQKKTMAAGCEPAFVREMIFALSDMIYGASLAGAGGGGFLILLTKKPNAIDSLRHRLSSRKINTSGMVFHTVSVDTAGLSLFLEEEEKKKKSG